jgi:outer membrane receptor for ferrienterochelin and colicin
MRNNWSAGVRHNFLPAIKSGAYPTNHATTVQGASSYSNFAAFGSYSLSKHVSLRGGIDNLFNTDPKIVGRQAGVTNANGATSPGFYDPIGRRFYLAAEVNF